jgi:hypothetical protein
MASGVIAKNANGVNPVEWRHDHCGDCGATSDERRCYRRLRGVHEHGIYRARVRPGIEVRLLDISAQGAAIESAYQLLPGRRLDLHLSFAAGAVVVRGLVLRCTVCFASVDRVTYRGALAFDRRVHWIIDADGVTGALVA